MSNTLAIRLEAARAQAARLFHDNRAFWGKARTLSGGPLAQARIERTVAKVLSDCSDLEPQVEAASSSAALDLEVTHIEAHLKDAADEYAEMRHEISLMEIAPDHPRMAHHVHGAAVALH